jgi:hypothetical protein
MDEKTKFIAELAKDITVASVPYILHPEEGDTPKNDPHLVTEFFAVCFSELKKVLK